MVDNMEIVRKEQYITSQWSGGTTTELLIYPETAKYDDRDFIWRISSAKVDLYESIFTHLPGILRHIMIIDGTMYLEHEGNYEIELEPFEQDSFMGEWNTKSKGRATDFNLMLTKGCTGSLNTIQIEAGESRGIMLDNNAKELKLITHVFYALNSGIVVNFNDKEYTLDKEDLCHITHKYNDDESKISFLNKTQKEIKIIETKICY